MGAKDIIAAARWNNAKNKVDQAVSVLVKHGLAYSRTDGLVGKIPDVSRREVKKINAAVDTMGKFEASFSSKQQRFNSEAPLSPIRYTPLKFASYYHVQKEAYEQLKESIHGRAPVAFLKRVNYDPRFQSHPNRRKLGISPEEAQAWAAEVEANWRDDKESKSWDESLQNNYSQLADIALGEYIGIGEFFAIRRKYFENDERVANTSIQLISPFQVRSPFLYGPYPVHYYGYRDNGLVAITAGEVLGLMEDGSYIENGIEYNGKDQEVAIWIEPPRFGDPWVRIPVFTETGFQQVLHGYIQTEPGQKRGIPEAASSWHEYCNIKDLCLFELESARLNTVVAGSVTADSNAQPGGKQGGINQVGEPGWETIDPGTGEALEPYQDPGYSVRKVDGGGFVIQNFTPGYKYTELDTKRPNINIPEYIDRLLKFGYPADHGVALSVATQKFEGSYNASKGAIDMSWKLGVEYILKQFSSDFHRPNWDTWLGGKVATGETPAPGWEDPRMKSAWSSMSVKTPQRPSLNPFVETRAAKMRVEEGFSNRELEAQQLTGTSAEENSERLRGENEKMADANEPLKEEAATNA